jgi:hypothetical protein
MFIKINKEKENEIMQAEIECSDVDSSILRLVEMLFGKKDSNLQIDIQEEEEVKPPEEHIAVESSIQEIQWTAFLTDWWKIVGKTPTTTKQFVIKSQQQFHNIPDEIKGFLDSDLSLLKKHTRIGKIFSSKLQIIFGDFFLTCKKTTSRTKQWIVNKKDNDESKSIVNPNNLDEIIKQANGVLSKQTSQGKNSLIFDLTPEEICKIYELLYSVYSISKFTGKYPGAINQILISNGYKLRTREESRQAQRKAGYLTINKLSEILKGRNIGKTKSVINDSTQLMTPNDFKILYEDGLFGMGRLGKKFKKGGTTIRKFVEMAGGKIRTREEGDVAKKQSGPLTDSRIRELLKKEE